MNWGECYLDCEGGLLLVHCASDNNYAVYGREEKGEAPRRVGPACCQVISRYNALSVPRANHREAIGRHAD